MTFDAEYEKEKKKTQKKIVKVLLIWGILLAGLVAYGVYWGFFDWSRFKDELITQSTSPNGTYTVNAYLFNGGATVSYTVLGELVFNKENKRPKKIYWQYREEKANIKWIDDNTVKINDVQLRLPYQTYDYRSGIK